LVSPVTSSTSAVASPPVTTPTSSVSVTARETTTASGVKSPTPAPIAPVTSMPKSGKANNASETNTVSGVKYPTPAATPDASISSYGKANTAKSEPPPMEEPRLGAAAARQLDKPGRRTNQNAGAAAARAALFDGKKLEAEKYIPPGTYSAK